MNATARRSLLGGAVALSLLMAACGSDSNSSSDTTAAAPATEAATTAAGAATTAGEPTTTGAAAPDLSKLSATLNASGATFPQAFYEDQIAAFQKDASGVTINYGGGGSGKGRQDLADQVVDWAGSDGVIKAEDLPKFKGGDVLYFPTVLAPITLSYNLDGVDKLQLTPTVVAKIFQRQITNWNDPAIAADNPDAKLPDQAITVARPRRRLGHDRELHQVPRRRRRDRGRWHVDAQERLDGAVAGGHPGRAGQLRRGPDRQLHAGRHRLRRPVRRQGRQPAVRRRARTRPASSSSRRSRRPRPPPRTSRSSPT